MISRMGIDFAVTNVPMPPFCMSSTFQIAANSRFSHIARKSIQKLSFCEVTVYWQDYYRFQVNLFFLSFFLGFRRPNLITAVSDWRFSHLGPKNLSRTGGPEHYLVYGRPKQIPNLVGKTDHNVGELACILRLTYSHNQTL